MAAPMKAPGQQQAPGCWNYPIVSLTSTRRPFAAGGETYTELPPPQPLSHVILSFEFVKVDGATANLPDALARFPSILFTYRGVSIWQCNAIDLYRMTKAVTRKTTQQVVAAGVGNLNASFDILIPFGRHLFHADECFPRVEKGDTQLSITYLGDQAGVMAPFSLTTTYYQLPMAEPKQFVRGTTYGTTATSTGTFDLDLPRAAPILGLGVVQTAGYPMATADSIADLKLLLNGIDTWYPSITMQAARLQAYYCSTGSLDQDAFAATGFTPVRTEGILEQFGYLDFDPTNDSYYAVQAQTCNSVQLRLNMATATAFRVVPLELWTVDMILPQGCVK